MAQRTAYRLLEMKERLGASGDALHLELNSFVQRLPDEASLLSGIQRLPSRGSNKEQLAKIAVKTADGRERLTITVDNLTQFEAVVGFLYERGYDVALDQPDRDAVFQVGADVIR